MAAQQGRRMTVIAEDRLVFENEEWLVTAEGLEHKGTGYFIDRESLSNRRGDGLWSWPLHMAEKRWCSLAPFTEAFTCAASVYEIRLDAELARSFNAARCEVAAWPKGISEPPRATVAGLRDGDRIPISVEAATSAKAWSGGIEPDVPSSRERASASLRRSRPRAGSIPAVAALHRQASRPIRRASTRLVRLLQAALYGR
jgi:hypothetical protein